MLFVAPLLLSIVLTRAKPEKQIIPPLYINLVAFAWFMAFVAIRYTSDFIVAIVLFGFFGYFGGAFLNSIAFSVLGIAVNPDDFVSYSFTAQADLQGIQSILDTDKYRDNIGVIHSDEDEKKSELTLQCRMVYRFVLRVTANYPVMSSTVTVVFYDRADWYVRPKNDSLREGAESIVSYLTSIFQRSQIGIIDAGWKETPGTQLLIRHVMDKMEGVIPRYKEVSLVGWLKIIAFLAAVTFIGVSAFILHDLPTSVGSFIVLLLYVVFELRSGREGRG